MVALVISFIDDRNFERESSREYDCSNAYIWPFLYFMRHITTNTFISDITVIEPSSCP
jgi:hypothetical protein